MKVKTIIVGTLLLLVDLLSPVKAQDIFSSPPARAQEMPYPTSAALLAATRNGEIPEKLEANQLRFEVTKSVVAILHSEYGADTNLNYGYSGFFGDLLSALTKYEMKDHDHSALEEYQRDHLVLVQSDPKVAESFDKLAIEYRKALMEYIVLKQRASAKLASEQAAEKTKEDAATDAMKAANDERKKKLDEVRASPAYKLWQAALKVEQGEKMINDAQAVLDNEDAVGQVSGVTDAKKRYAAGRDLVAGQKLVGDAFATYKQLGGTAKTPDEVQAGPDPAAQYR